MIPNVGSSTREADSYLSQDSEGDPVGNNFDSGCRDNDRQLYFGHAQSEVAERALNL
jgi:hypothetical protein